MSQDNLSPSLRYQKLLASLTELDLDAPLKKRVSEMFALLDFNSTLNGTLQLDEVLDLVLLVSMGETQASWAGILIADADGRLRPERRKGASASHSGDWGSLRFTLATGDLEDENASVFVGKAEAEDRECSSVLRRKRVDGILGSLSETTGARLISPLKHAGRLVGLLLLGPSKKGLGEEEAAFVDMLSVSAAAAIDNGRMVAQLADTNRSLSLKVYQLNSLFDLSHELNRPQESRRLSDSLVTNAMGRYLTTRAVLVQGTSIHARGVSPDPDGRSELIRLGHRLSAETGPATVSELGEEGEHVQALGFELVVPVKARETSAMLFLGARAGGQKPSSDDRDFLRSLASQAASAFDNLQLAEARIEAQKVQKEMAIAREIQRGLLPDRDPEPEGWDVAAINIPCLSVGGDYYDYVVRPDGTLWFVIADVSGKGTGPALLMASFQASLRALSSIGEMSLSELAVRLNELIYQSTETNKYVTAFLGALDTKTGELEYVNAGHCYPLLVRQVGEVEHLKDGGPVIGLLPKVPLSTGQTRLDSGDLLVSYTDGLSETSNPKEEEFEERRILEMVQEHRSRSSREIVARLVSGVRLFAADAGLADDLTLMVIKRR